MTFLQRILENDGMVTDQLLGRLALLVPDTIAIGKKLEEVGQGREGVGHSVLPVVLNRALLQVLRLHTTTGVAGVSNLIAISNKKELSRSLEVMEGKSVALRMNPLTIVGSVGAVAQRRGVMAASNEAATGAHRYSRLHHLFGILPALIRQTDGCNSIRHSRIRLCRLTMFSLKSHSKIPAAFEKLRLTGGFISKLLGLPPLVGQLAAGIILANATTGTTSNIDLPDDWHSRIRSSVSALGSTFLFSRVSRCCCCQSLCSQSKLSIIQPTGARCDTPPIRP